jgi:hypothetical protein
VTERAPLEPVDGGLVTRGEGWFVLSARETSWFEGHFGAYTRFEGATRFPQLGINILSVSARRDGDGVVYPVAELARRNGAGIDRETRDPEQAYANFPKDVAVAHRPCWLGEP